MKLKSKKKIMRIYILYTGGTIGSVGPVLKPLQTEGFVKAFKEYVEPTITQQVANVEIVYDGFDHTLDSTNMQPSGWVLMANKILDNYEYCDAFIVLHGTDTMAFTSSALSFLLPEISKPVIVTGSQLPIFYQKPDADPNSEEVSGVLYNTDALRNVLGAVEFGTFGMPEVCLYFADHLYRGNRVVKSNASEFVAFSSPNFPAIGEYGVLPKLNNALLLPQPKNETPGDWCVTAKANVALISKNIHLTATIPFLVFPAFYDEKTGSSLLVSVLENMVNPAPPKAPIPPPPPVKGVVLESYGEGNVPSYKEMKDLLKTIHDNGSVIVDCTQVFRGDVNYNAYATGAWLKNAGVISGFDMTAIAAIAKLIVLKAQYPADPLASIEDKMAENLSGELTPYYQLSGYQNEFLAPGEGLYSINGNYQFINTTEGELVLYDVSSPKRSVIWQKDLGQPGRLVMQADGNLVFYNKNFEPLFASDTGEIGVNGCFKLDNDGSLSIYNLYTNALIKKIN
jgi:L-asparaginase